MRRVAEDASFGQSVGDPVAAVDDDDDPLTYTLGGTDAASFSIVASSGQLLVGDPLDHEAKSRYSVTVSVSDMPGRQRGSGRRHRRHHHGHQSS